MSKKAHPRLVNVLLHFIFFLTGIGTVLIGQVLPIFAKEFSLSDLQLSFYFPFQFAGSLSGTYAASLLGKADRYVTATVAGAFSMAAGTLMMAVPSFGVGLCSFYLLGFGVGLTLPAINMMVIELDPARSSPALSVLNFCWGLGAILSKPFVDTFSSDGTVGSVPYILAVPLVISAVMLAAAAPRRHHVPSPQAQSSETEQTIWSLPLAWGIAAFNFVHVGYESGMGGWLTTYTGRVSDAAIFPGLSPTLLYFLLFVIGRGAAPVLFRFLNESKMLILGLTIVLAGMVLTLAAHNVLLLSIGASIAGFGTSWIFPTNVSRFAKIFGPGSTRRATPLFMAGTFGAAVVTWLIGFVSDRTGDLRWGMLVLGGSVLILLAIQAAVSVSLRRYQQPS